LETQSGCHSLPKAAAIFAVVLLTAAAMAFPVFLSGPDKAYRLEKFVQGGDFDLAKIEKGYVSGHIPVKRGPYLIYEFAATSSIPAPGGGTKERRDVLALKIGCSDEILDAWHYVPDAGGGFVLDRMSRHGLIMARGLRVDDLGLVRVPTGEAADEHGAIEIGQP
jgi:hypothetical protein